MPVIRPSSKTVTYSLDALSEIEASLLEIERVALEDESVSGGAARAICTELNNMRNQLMLPQGVQRHAKWATK